MKIPNYWRATWHTVRIIAPKVTAGIMLALLILAGYSQSWTGFSGYTDPAGNFHPSRTLWDWITVLALNQAQLVQARLSWANLEQANLREANLVGADLHRADLRGADLRGQVTPEQLEQARSFQAAILPEGMKQVQ